jgi:hypothetical protein
MSAFTLKKTIVEGVLEVNNELLHIGRSAITQLVEAIIIIYYNSTIND